MKSPKIDPGHGNTDISVELDKIQLDNDIEFLNKIRHGRVINRQDLHTPDTNNQATNYLTEGTSIEEKKNTKSTIIAIHMLGISCVVAMLMIAYFYYNYSLELLIIITIFGIILSLAFDITLKIIVFIIKKIIEWRNNIHG